MMQIVIYLICLIYLSDVCTAEFFFFNKYIQWTCKEYWAVQRRGS